MFCTSKAILPCLVFSSLVWSTSSADKLHDFGLFSRIHKISGVQQKPNTLAKKAALQWKQTGTIHYTNYGTADTVWRFYTRDCSTTIILEV